MKKGPDIPPRLLAIGGVAVMLAIAAFLLIPRGSDGATNDTAASLSTPTETTPTGGETGKGKAVKKKRVDPNKPHVPFALTSALVRNASVVVVIYRSRAYVDRQTHLEAQAGARAAGAGFVALDVTSERTARDLAVLLDEAERSARAATTAQDKLPATPTVLILERPLKIAMSFDGFVDQDVVAQAARAVAAAFLARG